MADSSRRPMRNKRVNIGMVVHSKPFNKRNEPPIHLHERILRASHRTL